MSDSLQHNLRNATMSIEFQLRQVEKYVAAIREQLVRIEKEVKKD